MLYSEINQSTFVVTSLNIYRFHRNTEMAATSKTMFLKKVSQFVRTTTSPKHPQSDIGLAMASHNVSGVMKDITSNTNKGATRRRIPKNK